MNSFINECSDVKKKYDICFHSWFNEKFLKGETDDVVCAPLFKDYQLCLKTANVRMEACKQLKEEYDGCFNIWFSQKFLKGDYNDDMCSQLLKVYKGCVQKTMKDQQIELNEVDQDNLGTSKEFQIPPEPNSNKKS